MSRNKLAMILLALMLLPVRALGDDIIDVDELTLETANYDLYTIEYGEYSKPATATGYMVYMVEQEMFMEEGTARLKKLHVMRNAEVKAGDVLATYEKEGSRAELERMELALKRAQEGFELGKQERTESLRTLKEQLGALTDATDIKLHQIRIQQAQLDYERYVYESERSIAQQQRNIDETREFYADTQLIAPFDGVITYVSNKNPGDTIYSGETLVTVQSQEKYLLGIDNSSGNFRYGMRVQVGIGPRNKKEYVEGRVVAAANVLPNENKVPQALIEMEPNDIKIGMKNISIEGKNIDMQNVLKVSRSAISFEGGKSYVSILDGDMVQKRIIVSGHTSAGDTWVVQGLSEGQEVIID